MGDSPPTSLTPDPNDYPPGYAEESNAGRIVGIIAVFHFIALTLVALRVYARLFMVRAFGVDDGLIIAAALLGLSAWICLVVQTQYGLGKHAVFTPIDDRKKFEEITFWKTVFSDGVAMGLLRISMALSLMRLKRDLKWYKWSLYAVIAFVVLYSIQAIVWLFVYCTPFSGWWEFQWMNPFDPRCHDFNIFLDLTYWNIACNIFTDVCLGALPVPIIWNLKMKLRVKLYVIGILNLGYLAVLMGVLKAVFMLTTGGHPDAIFDYWVHFWQNMQLNIGIIAACASFLKPLVGRMLKINSSAGYYPSDQPYGRSGQMGYGGSNAYGIRSGHTGTGRGGRTVDDEFEMHAKTGTVVHAQGDSSTAGTRSDHGRDGYGGGISDNNSEEIILQNPGPAPGIMRTTDFVVEYDSK